MVTNWLRQLLARMFSPISRREALRIASHALANNARGVQLICHGSKPQNCHIYNAPSEPCWYIYAPSGNGNGGVILRSSRVILVGKLTGTIHYDGSAGDEG